ncbi:MAG TPA: DUF3179 domain-containing (seleno)protein [Thermoanaerobaculia bacterium]
MLLLAATAAAGCLTHQYRSKPRVAVVDGDPIVQMKQPGEFPAVTKPSLVAPDQHSDPPDEDSRILGLTVGAVPRAYPIGLLDRFEVVNDAVPELSFVVARCALTAITAVYDRRVGKHVLEFQKSGALWRDTLVLRDRSTGTYWSAATGRALHGPLAGQRLRPIPAVVTRAGDWQRVFPASLTMDLDKDTSEPLFMRIYGASRWQGISGTKTADPRHKPKEEVFAVGEEDEALAFTAGEIEAAGGVETTLRGESISIYWDAALEALRAYGPKGDERAVVPMFWFAAARHYARVKTLVGIR